jgi:hypothetical protein
VARVEDPRLAEGGALAVVPVIQAELDEYAKISAASRADWGEYLVIVAVDWGGNCGPIPNVVALVNVNFTPENRGYLLRPA